MKQTTLKLQALLTKATTYFQTSSTAEIEYKSSLEKWSKKEILGHLIDSAINNLQRFTEIQFSPKPFAIKRYNQNKLVKVNAYQQMDTRELLGLWLSLNKQIERVISLQNEASLSYEILLDGTPLFDLSSTQVGKSDLRFLIEDYVNHMEHHLDIIFKK